MRAVAALAAVGGAARWVKGGVGNLLGRVNPDVWRELAFASATSYSLLFPKREEIAECEPDGFAPLVLVHGLGGNRGVWWPLRLFLRLHGHRRVWAFGYEEGTVQDHAGDLLRFVEEVLSVTGEERVDVVAHSLGGIIARYAVQRLGMGPAVRTLVTLATPHQGTWAAQWANTTLTRPLRPDSEMIADLNGEDLSDYGIRLVALHSDRDVYVVPARMMTHPDAENVFVPGVSHTQFLLAPSVFREVAKRLETVESPG